MKLNEAQRILNKNGLLMEESKPIVNTYFIDNTIKTLTKTKEELTPVRVPQVYTSAEYARKLCKNYFGW